MENIFENIAHAPVIGAPTSSRGISCKNARILVVDDDASLRMLARMTLEGIGFQVVEAGGGSAALRLIDEQAMDCVLLDWRMPDMSGQETCRQLRRRYNEKMLPIVIITGEHDKAAVQDAFAAGASDYVKKPVDWEVVRERIKSAVRDFGEHQRAQARIRQLEFFDEHTGLPNHKMMAITLDEEIEAAHTLGQSVHVLKITIGQFDNIAFTLGKEHGDYLMQAIGHRLHESSAWHFTNNGEFQDCRVLIGKTGEREFTLVYRGPASGNTFKSIADELGKQLRGPFLTDGYDVTIFPHLGMASFPTHASQASLLLERAAAAARHAMQDHQTACLVYSSQSHNSMIRRIDIESRMRKGLENGCFSLVYQPKVESTSRTMVGVEALLRWQDPELGSVSPGEFIPIAEQSGLIVPIGEFVLRAACMQARSWQQQGLSAPPIAINFSPQQFNQGAIIELIERELSINSLSGAALEIELTETAAMNNENNVIQILKYMRNIGVKSAIDDFGTGYSSMKYLRILPVDTVKIDRSFIKALATEESAQAITLAIIQMAHTLGKRVVAEGVEAEAQMDFLIEHGCELIQGFLTGRPESAEQTARRLVR